MAEQTSIPSTNRELRYDPHAIEQKWAARWQQDPALYAADPPSSQRKKYYVLEMLPYPSGALHMGHVRNYAIGDALARYMWMRGYNVLHPMGWDAFGLPAENAAIKNNTPPKEWTQRNIAHMKAQMQRLGFAYDWSTEVTTCLPEYYRWNQWFFLKMYERGLAYRKKSKVNWCPKCCTVLANEQVVNGCCWRHEDTPVEQRELEQWFLRITNYADELLRDLDVLDGWPEKVRTMQRNWIGRSEGSNIDFKVEGSDQKITVFTTRIDTIFGVTSIQLAPEHPLVADLIGNDHGLRTKIDELIAEQRKAKEIGDVGSIEKHGVATGRFAVNPFNKEKIPIWIANYIVMDYGSGAIMSVPAHDERDYEFAKKYGLEIRIVVLPRREGEPPKEGEPETHVLPYTGADSLLINSGEFSDLGCLEAQKKMAAFAEQHGFGKATVTFRLKDWGISRQRYWGTPIPMLYCEKCGVVPVPEKDLPVLLPENVDITLPGQSPLASVPEFVNATCPKCGGKARRETDTMDTFVDSSWYFYRYADPRNNHAPFDSKAVARWFPIDQYIGGITHAILHLIYSRFWTKVMRDLGLISWDEPVQRLFTQGMITHKGSAMSKSKGNVVSPDDIVARYGADSARLYILFAAPPDRDVDWNESGVEGVSRFLARVYRFVASHADPKFDFAKYKFVLTTPYASPQGKNLQRKLHATLRKITEDFEKRWHFNTSIAALMELMNELYLVVEGQLWSSEKLTARFLTSTHESDSTPHKAYESLLQGILRVYVILLAPFAPFLAHQLWEALGEKSNLLKEPWPQYDPALAKEDEIEIAVQMNGKLRSRVLVPAGAGEELLRERALADEKIRAALEGIGNRNGKQVVKVIVVPGKLVNIVVR